MAFRLSLAALAALPWLAACATLPAPTDAQRLTALSQDAFVEDLSRRTFDYFWETTSVERCLAPDRWPSNPFSSIAATGFALNAFGIGAERGYVTRSAAATRTRDCLAYYLDAPQGPGDGAVAGYKGFFYHFLNNDDGTRSGRTELSSVDTALMMGGVLFTQSYFDRDDPVEAEIRDLAERLYTRVDWPFFQRERSAIPSANSSGGKAIAMGWYPERATGEGKDRTLGDFGTHDWVAYDEGMLVYILALGSPTHAVGKDAWDSGWAARLEENWGHSYGQEYLQFEPLFGHQYSHIWVDFRGIRDPFMAAKGIDYFENSRRATLAQRAYGIENPQKWVGYSDNIWGWSASDGPSHVGTGQRVNGVVREFQGYAARGMSNERVTDDGTIAPTAAGGAIPFAPEVTLPALMAMRMQYGGHLYQRYGFKDAFNPSYTFTALGSPDGVVHPRYGWFARDYLGIDQGAILSMLENHRSGLVWRTMRKNPHIRRGLDRIGFTGGWLGPMPAPTTTPAPTP